VAWKPPSARVLRDSWCIPYPDCSNGVYDVSRRLPESELTFQRDRVCEHLWVFDDPMVRVRIRPVRAAVLDDIDQLDDTKHDTDGKRGRGKRVQHSRIDERTKARPSLGQDRCVMTLRARACVNYKRPAVIVLSPSNGSLHPWLPCPVYGTWVVGSCDLPRKGRWPTPTADGRSARA
jgi:hypothetical protein